MTGKHIAVVPVADLDARTQRALDYAGTLAGEVLAVHVRPAQGSDGVARSGVVERWAVAAPGVPLVVVPASTGGWQRPFVSALRALRRTQRPDLITVVLPNPTLSLRLALLLTPGVIVRATPPA